MKLRIEIELDNAAFVDDDVDNGQGGILGDEISRILRKLSHGEFDDAVIYGRLDVELRDVNGNIVGQARIED